ncbi:MAG: hypothetical protein AB8E15_00060 [Bdellovibrionales bacterium]
MDRDFKYNWLKDKKVCDFQMDPMQSELGAELLLFKENLSFMGLPSEIEFRFAEDWYYVQGTSIICIPFYFQTRILQALVTTYDPTIEGLLPSERKNLLLHEYGHFLDYLWASKKKYIRKKLFGSQKTYPKSYIPLKDKKSFVRNLGRQYSQSHPDEDFAETMAAAIKIVFEGDFYDYQLDDIAISKLNFCIELLLNSSQNEIESVYELDRNLLENQKFSLASFLQKLSTENTFLPVLRDKPKKNQNLSILFSQWKRIGSLNHRIQKEEIRLSIQCLEKSIGKYNLRPEYIDLEKSFIKLLTNKNHHYQL